MVSTGRNKDRPIEIHSERKKAAKAYDFGFGSPLTCDMDSTIWAWVHILVFQNIQSKISNFALTKSLDLY